MQGIAPIGRELSIVSVNTRDAVSIEGLARELAGTSSIANAERYLETARLLVERRHSALDSIRAALEQRPVACLIRGLRATTEEPTPTAPPKSLDLVQIPAATLGLVANIVGQ